MHDCSAPLIPSLCTHPPLSFSPFYFLSLSHCVAPSYTHLHTPSHVAPSHPHTLSLCCSLVPLTSHSLPVLLPCTLTLTPPPVLLPRTLTVTLPPCVAPSYCHPHTPSLCCSFVLSPSHSIPVLLLRTLTVTLYPCVAPSYTVTLTLPPCVAPSHLHCHTPSLCRSFAPSLSHSLCCSFIL